MDTYSPEAGRITTASLLSSDVAERFAEIHANDSQMQALSGLLKDNRLERAPWKDPVAGLRREYVSGDKKESFELCLEQYVNAKAKKRAVLVHLKLTGDTHKGNSYSFVMKEPNTLDDCGAVGADLCCNLETERLCICFTCGGRGGIISLVNPPPFAG